MKRLGFGIFGDYGVKWCECGVIKKTDKALEYYGKACDMGFNGGCEFYAKIIKGEM